MLEALILILSAVALVIGSRFLLKEVPVLSRAAGVSPFGISVVLLGILTSLPEISVAINAQMDGRPDIYAGNLIGGSFLILAFIIPIFVLLQGRLSLWALLRGGFSLTRHIDLRGITIFVLLISLPLITALDGTIQTIDAIAMIVVYLGFIALKKREGVIKQKRIKIPLQKIIFSVLKIVVFAVLIYGACFFLVRSIETLAIALNTPAFILSIILLSIGTNIPELSLAVQSIFQKRTDAAFGDYIGSAAANPLILGVFALINGPFSLGIAGYEWLLLAFLGMNLLFFLFAATKGKISKKEAVVLLCVYGSIVIYQTIMNSNS